MPEPQAVAEAEAQEEDDTLRLLLCVPVAHCVPDALTDTLAEGDRESDGVVLAVAADDGEMVPAAEADAEAPVERDGVGAVLDVAEPDDDAATKDGAADTDALAPRDNVGVADGDCGARRMATLRRRMVALATPASLMSQEYLDTSAPLDMMLLGANADTLVYRKHCAPKATPDDEELAAKGAPE